jgi:transcriptional regulator with XRE-family HTH domain
MADNREIAARMKALRLSMRMSQEFLADKLNIAQNTLSRWESGEKIISAEDLQRIAKALFVPVSHFLVDDPDEAKDPNEITAEPILDEVKIASSKGVLTKELIEETARWVRFRTDEEARKRGIDQ